MRIVSSSSNPADRNPNMNLRSKIAGRALGGAVMGEAEELIGHVAEKGVVPALVEGGKVVGEAFLPVSILIAAGTSIVVSHCLHRCHGKSLALGLSNGLKAELSVMAEGVTVGGGASTLVHLLPAVAHAIPGAGSVVAIALGILTNVVFKGPSIHLKIHNHARSPVTFTHSLLEMIKSQLRTVAQKMKLESQPQDSESALYSTKVWASA